MRFLQIFSLSLLFAVGLLWLSACGKEEDPPGPQQPTNVGSASIEVTVKHLYDISLSLDSAVAGAEVRLFDNRIAFEDDFGPEATRTTNAAGVALFEFRADEFYWIRAYHPSPELGTITDSVSTPSSSYSFVEMRYY